MACPVRASTLGSVADIREVGLFRVIDTQHPAGARLAPHAHERAGLTLVLRGGYRERMGRSDVDCRRGSIVYKPAAAAHSDWYGPDGARALHLELHADGALDQRIRLPDETLQLTGARAAALGARLEDEFRARDAVSDLALEALGVELLALVLRAPQRRSREAPWPGWLRQAVEMLHDHRAAPLTLSDVARAVDVPPRRVAQEFRRRFGVSVGEYGRKVRIDRAARRLAETDTPMARIALEAGFCDQSHFIRCFRRITGVTPGEHRRLRRA